MQKTKKVVRPATYTRKNPENGLQARTREELMSIGTPLALSLVKLNRSLKVIADELGVQYGVLRLWIKSNVEPDSEKSEKLQKIFSANSI